jgi:hypothetical protein
VLGLDLLDHRSRHPAGHPVRLEALEHAGLRREERLEQAADFFGRRPLGNLQRLPGLLGLVAIGKQLMADGRRRMPKRRATLLRCRRHERQSGEHESQRKRPTERHRAVP